jgi:hypothetical protein
MGAGTNVQKRLIALHHLDAPWKPAEIEQREGRILRQGNANPEVEIWRYVTAGSFDAYMYQTLETKAKFITQMMSGESGVRRAGSELSYAEVKAIASGNEHILTLAEADAELQRLAILRKNHSDEQFLARRSLKQLPDDIAFKEKMIENLTADAAMIAGNSGIIIGGRKCNAELAMAMLTEALNRIPPSPAQTRRYPLGTYHGIQFGLERQPSGHGLVYLEGRAYRIDNLTKESQGARAVLNGLGRIAANYESVIERFTRDKAIAETQLADFRSRHGLPFAHAEFADKLTTIRDGLRDALSDNTEGAADRVREFAEQVKTLMAGQKVEASTKQKMTRRAETPVTARLRRPEIVVNHEPVVEKETPETESPAESAESRFADVVMNRKPTQPALF